MALNSSIFNLLFWNIHGQKTRAIGNKFTDTKFLNICNKFDILGLAELHTSSTPNIEGFKLIKDKIRKKNHKGPKIAGGLAVFAKKDLAHLVKHVANECEDSVWVKICKGSKGGSRDLYIGTCYISPPKKTFRKKNKKVGDSDSSKGEDLKHNSLETFFGEAVDFMGKGDVILQGDFNARSGNENDYLPNDKYDGIFGIENHEDPPHRNSEDRKICERGSLLIDLCRSYDFRIANGRTLGDIFGKFTSMQWNGSAVVDYVITPAFSLQKIVELKIGEYYPWLSDHCPITYKLKTQLDRTTNEKTLVETSELPPKIRWNPETRAKFLEKIKSDNIKSSLQSLTDSDSPEEIISKLSLTLKQCASDDLVPTSKKHKHKNQTNKPWFDLECQKSKKALKGIAGKLKHNPHDVALRENLFVNKKKFRNLIRTKKREYKKSIIDKMHLTKSRDTKLFWKLLKKLDDNHSTKNPASNLSMDEWVNHYTELLQGSSSNSAYPNNKNEAGPLDYDITLEELQEAKSILKPGKATSFDLINNEMILESLNLYPETFLHAFNAILKCGRGFRQWSTSLLIPIHKKGPEDDPDNYRGIALISCLAKFFYSIINNRLLDFCLKNKILSPFQLGFLPGNRTSDAHIILHNLINEYCHKKGSKVYGCFVDFSKAFDNLPRDLLFKKLSNIGISGKFYDIITDLYSEDKICIKLDDKISSTIKTKMGVRQGCVLSPLLFNIFMADLPQSLNQEAHVKLTEGSTLNCIMWADDLLLLSETEKGLGNLIKDLKLYSDQNKLMINTKKTKCMIFNKTGRLIHRNFYLGETKLENVRNYKYLGLVVTPSGEIKSALDDLRARALKAYMAFKTNLGTLFNDYIDDTISIFDSMIKPILLYGSDFWGCIKCPKNNPIENLHMQFCRQILGVQKNTTTYGVLLELGRTPLMHEARKMSIKNWERIKLEKANQLIIKSHQNSCIEELNWTTTIRNTLAEHGLSFYYTNTNIKNKHLGFQRRAKDIFHQEAFSTIKEGSSKLRTYSLIKQSIGKEHYLSTIRNPKTRRTLSKFRLSNHKLRIESGRVEGLKCEERICQICSSDVEDETHFLVKCELYKDQREKIFALCVNLKPQFPFYSDKEKFIFMMTSHVLTDTISKFIDTAMSDRETFLDVSRSLHSIIDEIVKKDQNKQTK